MPRVQALTNVGPILGAVCDQVQMTLAGSLVISDQALASLDLIQQTEFHSSSQVYARSLSQTLPFDLVSLGLPQSLLSLSSLS